MQAVSSVENCARENLLKFQRDVAGRVSKITNRQSDTQRRLCTLMNAFLYLSTQPLTTSGYKAFSQILPREFRSIETLQQCGDSNAIIDKLVEISEQINAIDHEIRPVESWAKEQLQIPASMSLSRFLDTSAPLLPNTPSRFYHFIPEPGEKLRSQRQLIITTAIQRTHATQQNQLNLLKTYERFINSTLNLQVIFNYVMAISIA